MRLLGGHEIRLRGKRLAAAGGEGRHLEQRDRPVGTGNLEPPGRELDVGGGSLHQLGCQQPAARQPRSEEHTSELQSLMRISYAVFCLKKKNKNKSKTEQDNISEK